MKHKMNFTNYHVETGRALSLLLLAAGLMALTALPAMADDAPTLANTISNWSPNDPFNGGSATGQLIASASGNTVTVTGTVSGANNFLYLAIDPGVTVVWKANLSGVGGGSLSRPVLISLVGGGGVFDMASGGMINNTGGTGIGIRLYNNATLNVSGGTVKSQGTTAILIVYPDCVVNVSGGMVQGGSQYGVLFSNNSGGTLNVTGGSISANHAIQIQQSGCFISIGGSASITSPQNVTINAYNNTVIFFNGVSPIGGLQGNPVVIAWNGVGNSFTEGTSTNLSVSNTTAVWGLQGSVSGIYYTSENGGFIPVSGVTVTAAALAVLSVSPSGTNEAVSGNVTIVFSEPIGTAAAGTVLLDDGSAPVTLSGGSWSSNNMIYTIPYSGLTYSTTYTVGISGFQSASGNSMVSDNTHSFMTTVAPTYTISATPTSVSFGSLAGIYTQPAAQTVTITNTGTGSVTLTQPTATGYIIGALSTTTLSGTGATATFAVQPNAGLGVGNYDATIAVSGSGGASASVDVSFAVTPATITVGAQGGGLAIAGQGNGAINYHLTTAGIPNGFYTPVLNLPVGVTGITLDSQVGQFYVSGGSAILSLATDRTVAEGTYNISVSFGGATSNTFTLTVLPAQAYSVTYDLNGGTGTVPTELNHYPYEIFTAAQITGITPPAGKKFICWSPTTSTASVAALYAPGGMVYMQTSNLTLTAIWGDIGVPSGLPKVSSVTPSGTGTALSGNIVITFNTPMLQSHGQHFVWLNDLPMLPEGTWTDQYTYTVPYSGLAYSTPYTVHISGAFADASFNTLIGDDSHNFTTEALPTNVCQIGSAKYTSLDAAFAAVQNGEIITMLQDVNLPASAIVNTTAAFTLDLNTHTVSHQGMMQDAPFLINSGTVTIKNGSVSNSNNGGSYYPCGIGVNGGNVTLDNLTVTVTNDNSGIAVYVYAGRANILSGEYMGGGHAVITYGTITVTSGHFAVTNGVCFRTYNSGVVQLAQNSVASATATGVAYTSTTDWVTLNNNTTPTEKDITVKVVLTYTIAASPTTLNFGSLQVGYAQPAPQTVTITNTGTGTVTLTQPTATDYVLNLSPLNLVPGASATLTVQPKAGLAAGTYNEAITVNGTNGASATVDANFTVTAAPPIYGVSIGVFANGTVSADKISAAAGETVTLTATPDAGYELASIAVTGSGGAVVLNGFDALNALNGDFVMPDYDVTVTATFRKTQAQSDKEAIEAAAADIEGGTYRVAETTANTIAEVKIWLVNTLNDLFGQLHNTLFRASVPSVVGDVTVISITPAIAGTEANPAGTDGSFTYTVTLTVGATTLTTSETQGVIAATPFEATRSIELQLDQMTVTIINTGNAATGDLTLTLSGDNADAFTLPAATVSSLAVGGEAEITLTLQAGLAAGVYKATLTVSGEGLTTVSVEITYTETVTGIDNPQVNSLKAYVQNGTLHVGGLTAGKLWSLYSIAGTLVYQGVAYSAVAEINLPVQGVYIVKSGSQTVKVLY